MAMEKILNFTTPETRFLSNFYPYKNKRGEMYPHIVRVGYMDLIFDCVENAYQAAKSLYIKDMVQFTTMTPFDSKKFVDDGNLLIRPDWEDMKFSVMSDLVYQKFSGNEELKKMLTGTGNKELVEGNSWGDIYWGVDNGVGENNLGKILMTVRACLRHRGA